MWKSPEAGLCDNPGMPDPALHLSLEPALTDVITLHLTQRGKDESLRTFTVQCHAFFYSGDSSIDIYRVVDGHLVRWGTYMQLICVERED